MSSSRQIYGVAGSRSSLARSRAALSSRSAWMVGDIAAESIRQLRWQPSIGPAATCVLGNHEIARDTCGLFRPEVPAHLLIELLPRLPGPMRRDRPHQFDLRP